MTRLYDVLAPVLGIANALALLLVLVFLLLGPFRKFRVVLLYVVWELFATAALTIADMLLRGSAQMTHASQTDANKLYSRLYWTNDVIVDLLRFILVIVLIYKAADGSRRVLGRLLTALVVAAIVLPFLLFHLDFRSIQLASVRLLFPGAAWFNSASQLLNFGAALMNLILWATLIASKRRDPQVLMVSVGLGIVVTGAAISYGLRHFTPQGSLTAVLNLFLNLTQLGGWAIWCRAFWPVPRRKEVLDPAVPAL